MGITKEILDEIALSMAEYEMIVQRLGREPRPLELGMFGALWSEHCGYKHSRSLLKHFPSVSPRVLVGPGVENAGVVDIGDGLAITMKIESHNHPSAIEPYQGAATGVGGIVRDIFTMGARPIALLNSLRFGPLTDARNMHLFRGVVAGIGGYGNCLGIPNVGGEVMFSKSYSENPLVNAMCVGIVGHDGLLSAKAAGDGNVIMLVGADTGKDGIHGASGLASRGFEEGRELRSTVQVGNPFLEKCLLEACLELARSDVIVGMQDLGAAGLTSSAIEAASRGGAGLYLDTAKVPRRELDMTPYDVMLSESQERMLVVVQKGREEDVKMIFDRWDLDSQIIGHVTDDKIAYIVDGDTTVADLPVDLLVDAPSYSPVAHRPEWMDRLQAANLSELPSPLMSWGDVLLKLLASPNIASKEGVYCQYDHQVLDNTVVVPGADAAVLRIKGTNRGIALTTDGNGRQCFVNPSQGGALVVAEAARNLACVGARAIAITDGLNFGNPEKPEVYYQMEECIKGMAKACEVLSLPVISGNVSLYNESKGEAIYPTPIVGALGLLEDIDKRCTPEFQDPGDIVLMLGKAEQDVATLGASEYLEVMYDRVEGTVQIDLEFEGRVQSACLEAIELGLLKSAHDCSEGGLLVCLAECAIQGDVGFAGGWDVADSAAASFFGEGPSRVVVSLRASDISNLEMVAAKHEVPLTHLGVVRADRFSVGSDVEKEMSILTEAWRRGIGTPDPSNL